MKIVVLEGDSVGKDMSWNAFEQFGEVKVYEKAQQDEVNSKMYLFSSLFLVFCGTSRYNIY